jgi:hypothetical protein
VPIVAARPQPLAAARWPLAAVRVGAPAGKRTELAGGLEALSGRTEVDECRCRAILSPTTTDR